MSTGAGEPVEESNSDAGPPLENAHPRSGRDLRAATAVGGVLAVVVLGTLFVWKPAFVGVLVVVVAVAVWELTQALTRVHMRVPLVPVLLGAIMMLVGAYVGGVTPLVVGLGLTAVAVGVWRLGDHRPGFGRDVTAGVFTALYIPFLAGFALLMLQSDEGRSNDGVFADISNDGPWQVLALLVLAVASDTGGYGAGVMFGKHPMAPTVSPKKSWEGFGGSVVLALAAGVVLAVVVFDSAWWTGLVLGAAGVTGATLGDLGESLIKRDLGIKDMSRLLPGHGGLMDRLDSLLPTAPLVWLVFTYVVPG